MLSFLFVGTLQAQTSLEEIDKGWKTKPIDNVINGSLGIMLERFDQMWPTWMVGAVRNTMEKGLEKEVLEDETALTVTVDSKNGYVSVDDGGTDGEYMSACYWNRSNGHKLLAILVGKPTDPCIEILCTYDYDPQKKMLIPEPDILKGYRWGDRKEYTQLFCHLPKKGKDVQVDEWGNDSPVRHTFIWDGMKPVYSKTEPLEFNGVPPVMVHFKGSQPNIKDFVNALLSQEDIGESLNGMRQSWKMYLEGMKQIPGESFIVDTQNGYIGYDSELTETDRLVIECCYWNYTDKRYKLLAVSNDLYANGKPEAGQYTGIEFYRYDNTTRHMNIVYTDELGISTVLETPNGTEVVTHALPRQGKTMVYTYYLSSGKKIEIRLTWDGSKFILDN